MSKNYWMIRVNPEEYERARASGFPAMDFAVRQKRKAQRMQPGDQVLFYLMGPRRFPATATVVSASVQEPSRDRRDGRQNGDYNFRINLSPNFLMQEEDYIDVLQLGPTLDYVKRWAPEDWILAFQGNFHLLPQKDFNLIEGEMKKIATSRRRDRNNPAKRLENTSGNEVGHPSEEEAL